MSHSLHFNTRQPGQPRARETQRQCAALWGELLSPVLVGHRALVWSLRMCLLLTRPRSPLSWVSAGLPAAEEAAGAQDRQATQREMRSGRLPPGLLQLITNPRDSRNRGSIRHLRRWRSQRKLYGLPNSFHESLCVANVHWTTDYVCARPDASYLIFTHLHNHPKRQVLSVSPLHR